MSDRHAVRTTKPIVLMGHVVGESMQVEYRDGAPVFGKCYGADCSQAATSETALGFQFCEACFSRFYSDDRTFRMVVPTA